MSAWTIGDVTTCDVTDSSLNNMYQLFFNNTNFNEDISAWDTSNVTNMNSMFEGATSLTTVSLPDTSSVENMSDMFNGATALPASLCQQQVL